MGIGLDTEARISSWQRILLALLVLTSAVLLLNLKTEETVAGNFEVGTMAAFDKFGNAIPLRIEIQTDGSPIYAADKVNELNWQGKVPNGTRVTFDARRTKNVSAIFVINGTSYGAKVILDDYGTFNPAPIEPPGIPVKFVEIHADNVSFESVEIRIHYTDEELKGADKSTLTIYHWSGGEWQAMPTSIDAVNNELTTTAATLSEFAVSGGSGGSSRVLVATNRFVVLDDPRKPAGGAWNQSDFYLPWQADYSGWDYFTIFNKSTNINATALYMDRNGTPASGITINFTLWWPNGTLRATTLNSTDSNGLANTSFDLNRANYYGRWRIGASNGSTGDNTTFIYNWWGCSYSTGPCSVNHASSGFVPDAPGSAAANSPYTAGRDTTVTQRSDHYGGSTNCTYCHQSYDGKPGGGRTNWNNNTNYTSDVHRNISCNNANCHGPLTASVTTNTHRVNINISSCYNSACHGNMTAWDRIDISNKSTLNSSNVATALSLYSINSTSRNATFHTPDSAVPCIICHGPMHNITKPDESQRFIRNNITESSQCTTCHSSYNKHNNVVNCTVCHSEDVHVIQVFAQNATFVTYNMSNPNPARGNCTTCHQNATFLGVLRNQTKADPYSGNAPQVITPMEHSNDPGAGQKWNATPGYWNNSNQLTWCKYCHGETMHKISALGRPSLFNSTNTVNSSLASGTWCRSCHYPSYANYTDMVNTFSGDNKTVPPAIVPGTYYPAGATDHSGYAIANDNDCYGCHRGSTSYIAVTLFMHNLSIGSGGGADCVSCHDMGGSGAPANRRINASSIKQGVHKNLNNGTSNVTVLTDLIDKACWACHGNGTDPLSGHPTNYNIPYTCTDCHNRTSNLTYTTNASIRANLTTRVVYDHIQSPFYENISSTVNSSNATCAGCHNNSLVNYIDAGVLSLNANVSHYASRTNLAAPSTSCSLCHKNQANATLYWADTIRHAAKSEADSFCRNCHNTTNATTLHSRPLVKPSDIHSGFDWQNDDWNEQIPIGGSSESCQVCHDGAYTVKKVCEDCHTANGSGPRSTSWLRPDINDTIPIVYSHTNLSATINVPNQSTVYGRTLSSCFGFNNNTLAGTCHGISYKNRTISGGYFAFNRTVNPDQNNSPYHWTVTIDRMPNTTNCVFCHNQSSATIRAAWANPLQIATSGTHNWYTGSDNNQCWSCHIAAGMTLEDFHSANMTKAAGSADCVSCHDVPPVSGAPLSKRVNVTALKQGVHRNLNNGTSNVTVLTDLIDKACWACHGNGTEPSGHPSNFNTPYVCTDCHNRTSNLTYTTNASIIANLTTRVVYDHIQSPFYENISSTVNSSNATCAGCHNISKVAYTVNPEVVANLSANVSHYASRTDLVAPSTSCSLCHKNQANATLYWANTIRHAAKSEANSFCRNCHNTTNATTLHSSPLVKPSDIHSGFDWQNDDWNEQAPVGSSESCSSCHDGSYTVKKICEDCHIANGSGPMSNAWLRPDINDTIPIVYSHTNLSTSINVPNQSTVYGQTLSSCFGFNNNTLAGTCHGISYDNRSISGGYFAFNRTTGPDQNNSPYHWTVTIDRLPNTTSCVFCHNQSSATIRAAWANPLQIATSGTHTWYTGNDNNQCLGCHIAAGMTLKDFHSTNLTKQGGGADCVSCHDIPPGGSGAPLSKRVNATAVRQGVHKNLNNGTSNITVLSDLINKACWACHGNGTEPPSGHPSNYKTPYICTDCHNRTSNLTYTTNASIRANLTTRVVYEHIQSPFYENISSTVNSTNATCAGCHNNSKVAYTVNSEVVANLSANVSHYASRTNLAAPSTSCSLCHKNQANATLYWADTIRHAAYTEADSFCRNCHNTTNATTLHSRPLVKPSDIHSGFDWQNDDWNEQPPVGSSEACQVCHDGSYTVKKVCEDCHIANSSGPMSNAWLRSDINSTIPIVYSHTNLSTSINVPNQSTVYGQTLSSCFGFNNNTLAGTCHGISYKNRTISGGYFAFNRTTGYDQNNSPYHWTVTIDRLPDTANCVFCHNQSNATIRAAWANPTQIATSGTHTWYTGTDNAQCWDCHMSTGTAPKDFHQDTLIKPACTSCHYNYSYMSDRGRPDRYVNSTMYNSSVHWNVSCSNCHTKGHNNIGARKACEDCHVYQADPINDKSRHNVTADPYNYTIGGVSVVTITTCTTCHSASLYNNATSTYNSAAAKDCDYCHTYPDKNREYFY